MRKLLTITVFSISLLNISFSAYAMQKSPPMKTKDAAVIKLLSTPADKLQMCASKGLVGYQNALSATYLVKVEPIKAYAWALLAYYQIKRSGDQSLVDEHKREVLAFEREKLALTKAQITQAKALAYDIIINDGIDWPAKSWQDTKTWPKICQIEKKS